jgi:hypothetical protein
LLVREHARDYAGRARRFPSVTVATKEGRTRRDRDDEAHGACGATALSPRHCDAGVARLGSGRLV